MRVESNTKKVSHGFAVGSNCLNNSLSVGVKRDILTNLFCRFNSKANLDSNQFRNEGIGDNVQKVVKPEVNEIVFYTHLFLNSHMHAHTYIYVYIRHTLSIQHRTHKVSKRMNIHGNSLWRRTITCLISKWPKSIPWSPLKRERERERTRNKTT
jgi:hypothetical protein